MFLRARTARLTRTAVRGASTTTSSALHDGRIIYGHGSANLDRLAAARGASSKVWVTQPFVQDFVLTDNPLRASVAEPVGLTVKGEVVEYNLDAVEPFIAATNAAARQKIADAKSSLKSEAGLLDAFGNVRAINPSRTAAFRLRHKYASNIWLTAKTAAALLKVILPDSVPSLRLPFTKTLPFYNASEFEHPLEIERAPVVVTEQLYRRRILPRAVREHLVRVQEANGWPLGLYFTKAALTAFHLRVAPNQQPIDTSAICGGGAVTSEKDPTQHKFYNAACVVGGLQAALQAPGARPQNLEGGHADRLLTVHTNLFTGVELHGGLLAAAIIANVTAAPEFRSPYWLSLHQARQADLPLQQFAPFFEFVPPVPKQPDAADAVVDQRAVTVFNVAQLADPAAAFEFLRQ